MEDELGATGERKGEGGGGIPTVNIDHQSYSAFTVTGKQFSSAQSLDRLGRRGDMRDDSAEILFQSFLQKAIASSSGMGKNVHSLRVESHAIHIKHCCFVKRGE